MSRTGPDKPGDMVDIHSPADSNSADSNSCLGVMVGRVIRLAKDSNFIFKVGWIAFLPLFAIVVSLLLLFITEWICRLVGVVPCLYPLPTNTHKPLFAAYMYNTIYKT